MIFQNNFQKCEMIQNKEYTKQIQKKKYSNITNKTK